MDISEELNATGATVDEVEPFLELTPALVQKRRSQARIIFDRFIRNKAAIGGAVFLILLFVFCFLGPIALFATKRRLVARSSCSCSSSSVSWDRRSGGSPPMRRIS